MWICISAHERIEQHLPPLWRAGSQKAHDCTKRKGGDWVGVLLFPLWHGASHNQSGILDAYQRFFGGGGKKKK